MIPWELQHRMVVVDLDKKAPQKVVRKKRIIRRKIWKLNENQTRVRFEKRVKELVSTDAPDLWKPFRDGVLKACDELCGKKKSRRDQGDMWWWNEEVKDTITRKKAAFKELDVEGGRCLRGGDGRLGFIEEDRAKIWKEHMEKIMNEENE